MNCDATVLPGLADQLKAATWHLHQQAERSGIVRQLLTRSAARHDYCVYMRNLQHVYGGLEITDKKNSIPASVTAFCDRRLHRSERLKEDLRQLNCSATQLPLCDSARRYRERVETAAALRPVCLVGHYYVRYLGDLNGGQMIKKLIKQQFSLDDAQLSFYEFDEIADVPKYRTEYRRRIDHFGASRQQRQDIVQAAIDSFEFNIRLSEEVVGTAQSAA